MRQIVKKAGVILERRQEEQRRLEGQLHQSERLAALGEMTAGVAHEIRNPLGIISSTAELLQERLARYEPQNRLAQIIVEESNRLNEKVTEFLDFARPRVPNLRPCDLEAIINRSLELLDPGDRPPRHHGDPGYQLKRPGADGGPGSLASGLFEHVAQRHPGHAGRRASYGGHHPGVGGHGGQILFRDNGEGIDPEALKKILNPFFTTKERGSGLGLPIVKSIIEAHQGSLEISSAKGGRHLGHHYHSLPGIAESKLTSKRSTLSCQLRPGLFKSGR